MAVPETVLGLGLIPRGDDPARREHIAALARRLGYTVVEPADAAALLTAPSWAELLASVAAHGPGARVAVSVAIGRTMSEAVALAERNPQLGDVRAAGVFGTFERAQQQLLELADAGGSFLLAQLPDEPDMAEILATLRAAVSGPTVALRHGSQR